MYKKDSSSFKQAVEHNNSFSVEFDSTEFDDSLVEEGFKQEYEHYLFCHSNYLRDVTRKASEHAI
jgi:hypothetical protein